MNKKINTIILFLIFFIVFPTILYFVLNVGNLIGYKDNNSKNSTNEQNISQVPQENKKTNSIPSAKDEEKKEENLDNNSSTDKTKEEKQKIDTNVKLNNAIEDTSNQKIVKGTDYTVKSGDSLFSISVRAYGDKNHNEGIEKLRKENNIKNNELKVGQKIKIPE